MAEPFGSANMSGQQFSEQQQTKPNGAAQTFPPFLSGEDFIANYKPRRPLIRAWDLKPGWLYSLTGPTGSAKTAIALAETFRLTEQGYRVVYLAGENADDVRARVILMLHKLGLDRVPPTLRFVDRTFNLVDGMDHVRAEVGNMGGSDLIVIDTSPAFQVASGAMEENSNPEAIRWAQRLRELTRLQGEPVSLALCHPVKRPQTIEECLPRGGGGFIAEVDGNYATWLTAGDDDEKFFEFRTVGKFRGFFAPITYRLERATCPTLVDPDGNPSFTVWAKRSDDASLEKATRDQIQDDDAVLITMNDYPGKTFSESARLLGWFHKDDRPDKQRVDRAIKRLVKDSLARKYGRGYQLLAAGKTEAKRAADKVRGEAI